MSFFQLLKAAWNDFSTDKCSRMAAALAYYTAFSLTPLLVLIITLCGFIWNPDDIQGSLESQIESVIGAEGAQQIDTMLKKASNSDQGIWASVLSGALLIVGATGLVGQLQGAMNDAWEVEPDPEQGGLWNLLIKRIFSFGMICAIAFLLLVSLALNSVLASAGGVIANLLPGDISSVLLQVLNAVVSFAVITILFAVMFKFLPDAEVKWSDVAIGACLTAIFFVAGKFAIGAYLGSKNMSDTYGAAGSLALIMIWIYYSALIFLFGVELTQSWAKHRGGGITPSPGAVRVKETTESVDS